MFDCKVRSRLTALPFHGISAHAPFWGGIRALPLPFDKLTIFPFVSRALSKRAGGSQQGGYQREAHGTYPIVGPAARLCLSS
jgi:hypothetical protein